MEIDRWRKGKKSKRGKGRERKERKGKERKGRKQAIDVIKHGGKGKL